MADHILRPNRRAVMAGLAAAACQWPDQAAHAEQASRLRCKEDVLDLREGQPATPVWSLGDQPLRFKRGDRPEITLTNDLPVPALLNWRGLDGAAAAEPMLARPALAQHQAQTAPLAPPGIEAQQWINLFLKIASADDAIDFVAVAFITM